MVFVYIGNLPIQRIPLASFNYGLIPSETGLNKGFVLEFLIRKCQRPDGLPTWYAASGPAAKLTLPALNLKNRVNSSSEGPAQLTLSSAIQKDRVNFTKNTPVFFRKPWAINTPGPKSKESC